MHVFHSSHLNHLPGKELDLKSLAGKIGYEVKAETPVALSSGSNRRAESEFDSRTRSLATPFTHSLESDFNHSFCLEDHSFFTLFILPAGNAATKVHILI